MIEPTDFYVDRPSELPENHEGLPRIGFTHKYFQYVNITNV